MKQELEAPIMVDQGNQQASQMEIGSHRWGGEGCDLDDMDCSHVHLGHSSVFLPPLPLNKC